MCSEMSQYIPNTATSSVPRSMAVGRAPQPEAPDSGPGRAARRPTTFIRPRRGRSASPSTAEPGARRSGVGSGGLMIGAAGVRVLGLALPGAEHNPTAIGFAAAAVIGGYGVVCVLELVDWERLSLGGHAVVVAVLVGVVGVIGVW